MNYLSSEKFYNKKIIPSSWIRMKLKYVMTISENISNNPKNEKILSLTRDGIKIRSIDSNQGQIAESYDNYILVNEKDICMNPMDLLSGWVDISSYRGLISPAYYTIQVNENFDVDFIKFFLQSNYYRKNFFTLGKGVASHDNFGRWSLPISEFNNIVIYLPESKTEQKLISSYIDDEIRKINKLIQQVEKKKSFLNEYFETFIYNIVTKGIKKDEKFKPIKNSFVKNIPIDWSVKKLKYVVDKILDNRGKTPPYTQKGIPMLEIPNITKGSKNPYLEFEKFVEPNLVKKFERDIIQKNDILISTVGATSGKVVLIEKDPNYFICQNIVGLRFKDEIDPNYFYYFLSSKFFKNSLERINKSNTIDNLKVSIFVNVKCLIPPINEQIKISKILDEKRIEVEKKIKLENSKLKLLNEKKKSLICSIITGAYKIS